MAANIVEATLVSRYTDGISRGVEQTKNFFQRDLLAMQNAGAVFSAGFGGVFDRTSRTMTDWENRLRQASKNAQSEFSAIGFAAGAMSLAVAGGLFVLLRSIISTGLELAKEASEVTELKLAYEGLIATTGREADLLSRLKAATEGIVSTKELLRNANRLLQSGVAITNDQYVQLIDNTFKLSKASAVDGAQAISSMTDAVIKGNARGLQAIGVHLNVRDAVSDMAAAMGQSRSTLASSAQMQAFYTELLEETGRAAAKLPPDFVSLEDAAVRGEKVWKAYFVSLGEGILRSRVFQNLLQLVVAEMTRFGNTKEEVEAVSLAINRFFISFLKESATFLQLMAMMATAWDHLVAVAELAGTAIGNALVQVVLTVATRFQELFSLLGNLPGPLGAQFRAMASEIAKWMGETAQRVAANWERAANGLAQAGSSSIRFQGLATSARVLASEMAAYANETVKGTAGTNQHGDAAARAAGDQKKLNDQLKAYRDLLNQLQGRNLDSMAAARQKFSDDMRRIRELDLSALQADQRQQVRDGLRRAALDAFHRERMKQIDEWSEKEATIWQRLSDFERNARQQRMEESAKRLPADVGIQDDSYIRMQRQAHEERKREMQELDRILREQMTRRGNDQNRWLEPLTELHDILQQLNKLQMDPFHQTMAAMKASVSDFGAQAGQAWASFWADLASGQENAGKKLLAAFIGMIGQMLIKIGVLLMQTGLAEIILAQTLIGRLMGASTVAGIKAMAIGAVLAAAGGVMQGAASSIAGTNQAGASATFQQGVPRPISGSTQQVIIQSGKTGASQVPTGQTDQPREILIRLAPGLVSSEVARSQRRNDQGVRVAVEQMAY